MDDKLKLWRESKGVGRPTAIPVSKTARPTATLQSKNLPSHPTTMQKTFLGKPQDKSLDSQRNSTRKSNDYSATTIQHQQARIQELEAELQRMTSTMAPQADLDDLVNQNLALATELEETNSLLRECQEVLEAHADAAPDNADLQTLIAEQAQTIERLEAHILEASFRPDLSLTIPNRKRSYEELQSALDEVIDENERLHKRISILEPLVLANQQDQAEPRSVSLSGGFMRSRFKAVFFYSRMAPKFRGPDKYP
ncbi:hypothetical protein H4R33_000965 [Dimargaris cristalligena]|nr:hypothetical protein H4R33_000965 [Dimargaris cristalligena]